MTGKRILFVDKMGTAEGAESMYMQLLQQEYQAPYDSFIDTINTRRVMSYGDALEEMEKREYDLVLVHKKHNPDHDDMGLQSFIEGLRNFSKLGTKAKAPMIVFSNALEFDEEIEGISGDQGAKTVQVGGKETTSLAERIQEGGKNVTTNIFAQLPITKDWIEVVFGFINTIDEANKQLTAEAAAGAEAAGHRIEGPTPPP